MDSTQKSCELSQSVKSSLKINYNKRKWNCATSQVFLQGYIRDLNTDTTVDGPTQDENCRRVTRSTASGSKRMKLDYEEPPAWKYQVNNMTKTINWREKLCKCDACLKMYENHYIEFLFFIKNIECLPTEILLKIFKYLRPSDRKIASECCKRFLDIWLCDDFLDDRHLVFDCCVLDPKREPLSVFMKSSRVYHTLAFGDVRIRGDSVFTGKFRENVTTVELMKTGSYQYHEHEMLPLLSTFPNLNTIKVYDVRQLGDFSNLPTNLELLVIFDDDWWFGGEIDEHDLDMLLKRYLDKTPNSHRVELNRIIKAKQILKLTESQRNKIQGVHLRLEKNDKTFKLPRFENLKYLTLDFSCQCDYGTEEILDNLEQQCPALKDLSIQICDRLPHKNWACLKTLGAHRIPKEEWSRLSIFENLEELSILTEDKCFNLHQTFPNTNLKKLAIHFSSSVGANPFNEDSCDTCFETIIKSSPALEKLRCAYTFKNNQMKVLVKNTPKLKCFELRAVDPSVSFECLPNLTKLTELTFDLRIPLEPKIVKTFPLMQHLKILAIKFRRFDFETVSMFEKMPALEDLSLYCDNIDDNHVSLFDTMSQPLKRLKKSEFKFYLFGQKKCLEIVGVIAKNCNHLQHIRVCDDVTYIEGWEKLLQKFSSLRTINGAWLEKYKK